MCDIVYYWCFKDGEFWKTVKLLEHFEQFSDKGQQFGSTSYFLSTNYHKICFFQEFHGYDPSDYSIYTNNQLVS